MRRRIGFGKIQAVDCGSPFERLPDEKDVRIFVETQRRHAGLACDVELAERPPFIAPRGLDQMVNYRAVHGRSQADNTLPIRRPVTDSIGVPFNQLALARVDIQLEDVRIGGGLEVQRNEYGAIVAWDGPYHRVLYLRRISVAKCAAVEIRWDQIGLEIGAVTVDRKHTRLNPFEIRYSANLHVNDIHTDKETVIIDPLKPIEKIGDIVTFKKTAQILSVVSGGDQVCLATDVLNRRQVCPRRGQFHGPYQRQRSEGFEGNKTGRLVS